MCTVTLHPGSIISLRGSAVVMDNLNRSSFFHMLTSSRITFLITSPSSVLLKLELSPIKSSQIQLNALIPNGLHVAGRFFRRVRHGWSSSKQFIMPPNRQWMYNPQTPQLSEFIQLLLINFKTFFLNKRILDGRWTMAHFVTFLQTSGTTVDASVDSSTNMLAVPSDGVFRLGSIGVTLHACNDCSRSRPDVPKQTALRNCAKMLNTQQNSMMLTPCSKPSTGTPQSGPWPGPDSEPLKDRSLISTWPMH